MANEIDIKGVSGEKILRDALAECCGIATYARLQKKIKDGDFGKEFQKEWCKFYAVTQRNNVWRKKFFTVFKECKTEADNGEKITLEKILRKLRRGKDIKNFELSFATKMLSGIDDSKPIIDTHVTKYFGLELRGGRDFEIRLTNALEQYTELEKSYEKFFAGDKAKAVIEIFDRTFPDYAYISDVKKIDFFIYWKGKFGVQTNE